MTKFLTTWMFVNIVIQVVKLENAQLEIIPINVLNVYLSSHFINSNSTCVEAIHCG